MTTETAVGQFGLPSTPFTWFVLGLSALAAAGAWWRGRAGSLGRPLRRLPHEPLLLALVASGLSLAYVHFILDGAPRIIDATSYYLQARNFASGSLVLEVPTPRAAFSGRFLLPTPDPNSLAVIFPPGYPAMLSLAFLLGRPMLFGPLLAAIVVLLTYRLASTLFPERPEVARMAALLSVLCATLRYHTADTMSHGAATVLLGACVLWLLQEHGWSRWLAGAVAGLLFATRPVTALVALCLGLVLLRAQPKQLLKFAAGAVPGVLFYCLYQAVATGSWFGSAQLSYYHLSDSPAGCFGYGLSLSRGCQFEHGDFVQAYLPQGFGLVEALATSWRRVVMHLRDAGNVELFALLLPIAAVRGRRQSHVRLVALIPVALLIVYAPFYFDGNYPAGGARVLTEALPFEHILLAWLLAGRPLGRYVPAVALLGFALHTSHDHEHLAKRVEGSALFDADVIKRFATAPALVFVTTDHGFNLAMDPSANAAIRVARLNRDAHDTLLWEALGKPPSYVYQHSELPPRLLPYTPAQLRRFEAEAQWPVARLAGGSIRPTSATKCSSTGGLRLISDGGPVSLDLEIHTSGGTHRVAVGWMADSGKFSLEVGGSNTKVMRSTPGCFETVTQATLERGLRWMTIEFSPASEASTEAVVDYFDVSPLEVLSGAME